MPKEFLSRERLSAMGRGARAAIALQGAAVETRGSIARARAAGAARTTSTSKSVGPTPESQQSRNKSAMQHMIAQQSRNILFRMGFIANLRPGSSGSKLSLPMA
jgi:hypothetical protein